MSEKMKAGKQKRSKRIAAMKELFQKVEGGVLTNFRGLDMEQMTDLRRRFREKGVSYKVVKNTLTSIAVEGTEYQDLKKLLAGPTGIAYTSEDPITPAQVAAEFAKENEAFSLKGGFMEGQVLNEQEVAEVSRLTGVKDLKAQFLSILNGPAQRLLGVLNGVPQKFLGVLKARAEQLEAK
jgi:large subunit ribosomal protein L10